MIATIVKCDIYTCIYNGGVTEGAVGECTLKMLHIEDKVTVCPGCKGIADDQPVCKDYILDKKRIVLIF